MTKFLNNYSFLPKERKMVKAGPVSFCLRQLEDMVIVMQHPISRDATTKKYKIHANSLCSI